MASFFPMLHQNVSKPSTLKVSILQNMNSEFLFAVFHEAASPLASEIKPAAETARHRLAVNTSASY
jgi:hypothetical protein